MKNYSKNKTILFLIKNKNMIMYQFHNQFLKQKHKKRKRIENKKMINNMQKCKNRKYRDKILESKVGEMSKMKIA